MGLGNWAQVPRYPDAGHLGLACMDLLRVRRRGERHQRLCGWISVAAVFPRATHSACLLLTYQ